MATRELAVTKERRYIVRIELYGLPGSEKADRKIYDELHEEMEKEGFERTVVLNDVEKKLPPAEYRTVTNNEAEDDADLEDVMARAKKAAKEAHPHYRIGVWLYSLGRYYNLEKA